MFEPILDMTGRKNETRLRLETAIILAMVLRDNTVSFQDLNAALDKWYSALSGKGRDRILNVISNPSREGDSVSIEMELFNGPEKGTRFRLTSACKGLDDIQEREDGAKIEVISPDNGERSAATSVHGRGGVMRDIPPESMREKIDVLRVLEAAVDGMSDPCDRFRRASMETLKFFLESGLVGKKEILETRCLDSLFAGLKDSDGKVREISAGIIVLLLKKNILSRDEIKKKIPVDELNRVLSIKVPGMQTGSAGAIACLAKAGLLDKTEIREKGFLGDLIKKLNNGGRYLSVTEIKIIRIFGKTGIIRKNELRTAAMMAGLIGRITALEELSRKEWIQALTFFIEEDIFSGEELRNRFPWWGICSNITMNNGKVREATGELIKVLVEKGHINRNRARSMVSLSSLISGLRGSVVEDIRSGSAAAIKALVEAGVVSREELKGQVRLSDYSYELFTLNMLLRVRIAKAIEILGKAGIITEEEMEDRPGMDVLISKTRDTGDERYKYALETGAIRAFIEAGLIDPDELRSRTFLESLMAGLEEPQDAVREGSLTAVKALFKAKTAAGEYAGGMTFEELESIFRGIHNRELPAGFCHYYLRLLYLLGDNGKAIARIERYLIPSLLDLSRVDGDFFYTELSGMIKDGIAPAEALRNLEKSLQLRSVGIMRTADIRGFRFFARKLGRVLAHLLVSGRKITKKIAAALRPISIAMTDVSDVVDTTAAVAGSCLRELPVPELHESPVPLPGFRPAEVSDMPVAGHDIFSGLLKGGVFHAALGRTIVYRKGQEYFAFKFLKKTRHITPAGKEEYETEDPGRLVYESEFFDYLNKLKESDPGLLKGDYPRAVPVDDKRAIRVSTGLIPGEMESRLKESVSKTAKPGEVTEIDDTGGCYTVMVYKTGSPDYFTYLHEAEDDGKASEACVRNIHDLFVLAGYGLIHPDIIELFHNIHDPRPDRGVYLWMADILRPDLPRQGAGRIHGWETTVLYPNMRLSGLADFAEIVSLKDLLSLTHHHSDYMEIGLRELPERERGKFLLAHYMGNYLLAWALNEGKRLKSSDGLDWKDKRKIRSLGKRLKDVYSEAYGAFTGEAEEDIGALVDWEMFATQMAFFMGGAYKEYTDKDIPEKVFGLKDLRIAPGNGWGYIHRDVIEEALSARKGIRTKPVIEKYFVRPPARRPFHPDVLIFRPDFAFLIKGEKDRTLASGLEKLHREYSKGWRFDGKNDDLGPLNGPNPLTELVRANYIYTMAMIGRHERHSAGDSGNEIERPLSSIPEHEIKNTGTRSRDVFTRVKAYLAGIKDETPVKGKTAPIDIVIDLSLIPALDIRENMETWAYLILSCIRMRNVNFIFEIPDVTGEGAVPESLRKDIENAAEAADVLAMLKDMIREKALLFGQDEDVEDIVGQRINAGRRDNAVEIPIISKAYLEWAREMDMELAPNQYPVAMAGRTAGREGEVPLRNFEAALTIGLAKASLVVARRRDDEKSGEEKEFPLLKRKLVEKLQKLYGVFREDVIFTAETLDNMVHPSSKVRLNLAISLALPPVTRMYFDRLRDLHDNIQLALQVA
ncbi:MAG: hypothetical protein U9R44_07805 [Candidatus Omnitrophota bacterium]|nr:hypothetical protein [Candidatus Omnitrophota bacterium]